MPNHIVMSPKQFEELRKVFKDMQNKKKNEDFLLEQLNKETPYTTKKVKKNARSKPRTNKRST